MVASAATAIAIGALLWRLHRARLRISRPRMIMVASTSAARAHEAAIRDLVLASFSEQFEDAHTRAELETDALDVLAGFHDAADCEWLLAMTPCGALVGLAMTAPYHDSLYVASLCVAPEERGRGLGRQLMRSASAHAAARGLDALSGSVVGGADRLIRFYTALGGSIEPNHAIASAGAPQPMTRLRAPSGPQTAKGVPPPIHLPAGARRHRQPDRQP
jgi:ribosomal protein S18 acetylase RimI-like enzyme